MKALITLIAAILASAAAQAGVPIQHWTTASGTRVYLVETHSLPMLDVQIAFDAGTARDPLGKEGLASMTLDLLDRGAGKLDEQTIADRFADIGVQSGGGAESDRAVISLRVLSSKSERDKAISLLSTVLAQPTFPAAILERERTRSIAELRESLTQPATILARHFAQASFGNHPYGRDDTEASLKRITRKDVVDFHRRYYTSRNAVLTLVGDISRADAEAAALQLTARLPDGERPPALIDAVMPQGNTLRIPHSATQAHVAIGMPTIRRGDPDQFPLVVGNHALGGGGFVSRLMKEVRDARGLSYSVFSYFQPMAAAGPFQIGLQTKAEQAEDAVKVVRETLATFLRDGPSAAELQAAKDNFINGFALRLDSNRKLLDQVGIIAFYNLPLDYLDHYADKVRAVTAEQIKDAFQRRVRPESLVTVIVGSTATGNK